jgi:hypothetical protein
MRLAVPTILLTLLSVLFFSCTNSSMLHWEDLGDGVYLGTWELTEPSVRIWALRFSTQQRDWEWVWEGSYGELETVKSFVLDHRLSGGINGGPFWGKGVPLGYLKTPEDDLTGPSARFWALAWNADYTLRLLSPGEEAQADEWVLGGYYPLLVGGQKYPDEDDRHPRTAVAWTKEGEFIYWVIVDGRQVASVGMTQGELSEFLLGLGAFEAINFDGGGSTTLVLDYGQGVQVVNNPRDDVLWGGERPVGSKIGFRLGAGE